MNTLTRLTAQIGNVLAEIRQRNELIEKAQKMSNPTFMEIITELEKDDKTLCNMLLLWYCDKYLNDPVDMPEVMDMVKKFTSKVRKDKHGGYETDGCGNPVYIPSC